MNWILLRGLARESRHWGEFPARFAEALPGVRVRTIDLPGNGARHAERSPTHISAMTDAVREQAHGERVHLLGLSLGGMVCADWASRYPDEVAACVVVSTSMRPSFFFRRLSPSGTAGILKFMMKKNPVKREAAILALTSTTGAALAETWATYATEHPVSTTNALRQVVAAARFSAPPSLRVPALVLAGARDRLVDPRCSEELAARWNAPLAMHPDAGHDLPLDDPAWVATRVKDWLGGLL